MSIWSKIKIFGIAFILLALLGGGYYYFKYGQSDMPPSINFENTKGAYIKKDKLPVKYTAQDISRFKACDESAKISFKQGSNVIYFAKNTSVGQLLDQYIVPQDGLRLDLAYYSPGEGNIAAGFHSFNGVVSGIPMSNDFEIPKNRPVIVVADQRGQFCNVDDNLKTVADYLSADDSISSLSNIQSGWTLIASGESLSATIEASDIPLERIDKIFTISPDLKTYSKLEAVNEFDSRLDSSVVWLKINKEKPSIGGNNKTKAANSEKIQDPADSADSSLTTRPPQTAEPEQTTEEPGQAEEPEQTEDLGQKNDHKDDSAAINIALSSDEGNFKPINLGEEKAKIISFTLQADRDLNIKTMKVLATFDYFEKMELVEKDSGKTISIVETNNLGSEKVLSFSAGEFTLQKDSPKELEIIVYSISDSLVTSRGNDNDLLISIPTDQGSTTFYEKEVQVSSKEPVEARHEMLQAQSTSTENPESENGDTGTIPDFDGKSTGPVSATATLVSDSVNSQAIVPGSVVAPIMKFSLLAEQDMNVKKIKFNLSSTQYFPGVRLENKSRSMAKVQETANAETAISIIFNSGDLKLKANKSAELQLFAFEVRDDIDLNSTPLTVSLESVEFFEDFGDITTEISATHNFESAKLTVTALDAAAAYGIQEGPSTANRFQISSNIDMNLTDITIEHVDKALNTDWQSYDHYEVFIGLTGIISENISVNGNIDGNQKVIQLAGDGFEMKKGETYIVQIRVYASDMAVVGGKSQFNVTELGTQAFTDRIEINPLPIQGPIITIE